MSLKMKSYLKILLIFLVLLPILALSVYLYKNIHNGITLNGEQTKTFIFNGIAYDIYQLRPFEGTMSSVRNNIKYEVNVRNGKLSGKVMGYYSNGNLKSMVISKKDNGCSLFYYKNGNLSARFCFKNGQFDGIQQFFYENGNLKMQSYFQNDELVGEQFVYRENGTLWYRIIEEKEKAEEFDENGNLIGFVNNPKKMKQKLEEVFNGKN